ncbi:MAG: S41 family peptidase [Phycisphaerales bacterium]
MLEHLVERTSGSLQMEVPQVYLPDRAMVVLSKVMPWTIQPREPHIDQASTRVVFLSGNGSISYCESVLSVVESLKLGTVIGQRTAGTNGNINPFVLPGGYRVVFTGMRVTKDDGRTHHGVGIVPNVEVPITAAGIKAGRDEVIEAAVKWIAEHPAAATEPTPAKDATPK